MDGKELFLQLVIALAPEMNNGSREYAQETADRIVEYACRIIRAIDDYDSSLLADEDYGINCANIDAFLKGFAKEKRTKKEKKPVEAM